MAKGKKLTSTGEVDTVEYKFPTVKAELVGESIASQSPARLSTSSSFSGSIATRFPHLNSIELPYQNNGGAITICDSILLCQKAYTRVPIYKNSIDMMSELANAEVYLTKGNKESQEFTKAWFKRINLWKLKDQYFRECFRSGNLFFYRIDGKISGLKNKTESEIPLRYILLNPANIAVLNDINFENATYFRILTQTEVNLLKNSSNQDDKEVYKNLPDAIKNYFDGVSKPELRPIDKTKLHTIFYKKQDYEPFAVPMGFSVMDSIELKMAMQKADSCIARTVEYIILLVTMGAKKEDGGINPENFNMLKQAFKTEKLGRVLVADYTTKAEFIIPDLNKVMGKEKYAVVNDDIANGLMNIFFGENKYANMMGKLKVFVEKLNDAQELFINEFLAPEVKRVNQLAGFKNYPIPRFKKITLDDPTNLMRVYAQLLQMGILTPKDGVEAMERGELPDFEDVLSNQKDYREDRDKGLFEPLLGGPYSTEKMIDVQTKSSIKIQKETAKLQPKKEDPTSVLRTNPKKGAIPDKGGRPPNINTKQSKKTITPIGASIEESFSTMKLIEVTAKYSELEEKIAEIGESKGIELGGEIIDIIAKSICENEPSDLWFEKIEKYIESPEPPNLHNIADIQEIELEYGIDNKLARLLFHCKI